MGTMRSLGERMAQKIQGDLDWDDNVQEKGLLRLQQGGKREDREKEGPANGDGGGIDLVESERQGLQWNAWA